MNRFEQVSRRQWLSQTAVVGAAALTPTMVFGRNRRTPPSDRMVVGVIGCGKMANDYHLPELLRMDDVQVVAVCEVDETRLQHARKKVDAAYEATSNGGGCSATKDFRQIISRNDIDAVCIATPDHWHAIPIIEACKSGKDVYCEKPLTLTIAEAKACVDAARYHQRVCQVGSQQRSNVFGPFREAVEIIRSGRLGKIERVTVGVGDPSVPCNLPGEAMEPGLDWDMWLGPAPMRAYHSILSPRGVHNHFPAWRRYREYSGGGHTDMGAHHYDIAQWALDLDQSGPVRIVPPDQPNAKRGVTYHLASGVVIKHGGPGGCEFHGSAGRLRIDRGHLSSEPESIVSEPLGKDDVHLFRSPGHHRNWIDCIKSRATPVADIEYGARTVTMIHLGNLAYWHRRPFGWDPEQWKFADAADMELLDRPRRDPWQLPDVQ